MILEFTVQYTNHHGWRQRDHLGESFTPAERFIMAGFCLIWRAIQYVSWPNGRAGLTHPYIEGNLGTGSTIVVQNCLCFSLCFYKSHCLIVQEQMTEKTNDPCFHSGF
jgi:hypothetical protein